MFSFGDEVVLTVDNPFGATDLPAGSFGTVLCGTTWEEIEYIYISWDNWSNGHNELSLCACGDGTDDFDQSHWWVVCDQIDFGSSLDCACESAFAAGDRVASLVDYPSGNADIFVGDLGTVVCGAEWTDTRLMVDWDDLTNGHDGNDACGCGEDGLPSGSTTGWFLECSEIHLIGCTGDLNGSGDVDVNDLLELIAQWGSCGTICSADISGDGVVDVNDLLALIAAWGACGVDNTQGACWLVSNTCGVMTEAECEQLGGLGWVSEATCDDTDGDRIPDVFELGDCSTANGGFVGSDPNLADTDGDGLDDGDEVYGTLGGLDLSAFGCNPCRIDLLIETDWIYSKGQSVDRNKLHINQVNRVVNSFANAPVSNIDGSTGITIHIDYGQIPYGNGNSFRDPNNNSMLNMNNWELDGSEYQTVKDANFDTNRHGYFHYCLLADAYSVDGSWINSSGLAELQGDDFIVSMGQWSVGDTDSIGNTFMHELGHNLNLRHGGDEDRHYKPNYNSVMNYSYQMCGIDTNGDSLPDQALDYSSGTNMDLLEFSLYESEGVTGNGPAIDWNQDGDTTDTLLQRNINCRITNTYANSTCGSHAHQSIWCNYLGECDDTTCDVLHDYDDWANISLSGLTESDLVPREVIHCVLDGSR